MIAIGLVHLVGVSLPGFPVINAARAGMQNLMGQGLAQGGFRAVKQLFRHLDLKGAALFNTTAKAGLGPAVYPDPGGNSRRIGNAQGPGLSQNLPQQGVRVMGPDARFISFGQRAASAREYAMGI